MDLLNEPHRAVLAGRSTGTVPDGGEGRLNIQGFVPNNECVVVEAAAAAVVPEVRSDDGVASVDTASLPDANSELEIVETWTVDEAWFKAVPEMLTGLRGAAAVVSSAGGPLPLPEQCRACPPCPS